MKKKFAVIGIGKFGLHIAKTLAEHKNSEVIVIDNDEDVINQIEPFVDNAFKIDAMDEKSLRETGIENVDMAIVSIGENVEANLIVVMQLLDIGIKDLIVKAVNPLHRRILEKIGVTRIVDPEKEMAIKVAHSLLTVNVLEEIHLSEEYSVFEIIAPNKIIGKTLGSLDLRKKYKVSVLGIKHGNKVSVNPSADDVVYKDDILIVLADSKSISRFAD